MKTVVSLAHLDLSNRARTLVSATDDLVRELKERFPEAQGYAYKIEERLAPWAWTRGTKMSEQEMIHSLDPENRKRAFRRGIVHDDFRQRRLAGGVLAPGDRHHKSRMR